MSNNIDAPIQKLKLSLLTKDDILKMSFGRVSEKSQNRDCNVNEPNTIFDYKIFGLQSNRLQEPSISSQIGDKKDIYEQLAMCNIGHIELPMPLLQPGYTTTNRSYIKSILGLSSNTIITQLVNGEYYLCAPKKGIPIEEAAKRYVSYLTTLETTGDLKILSKQGKIILQSIDNFHKVKAADGDPIEKYKSTLFAIHKSVLINPTGQVRLNFVELKNSFTILTNVYSIVELLSYIDLNDEINYVKQQLTAQKTALSKHVNNLMGGDASKDVLEPIGYNISELESEDKVLSSLVAKKINKGIKALQKRFKYLRGFKETGKSPLDLVTNVVPVIPIAYRERKAVENGHSIKITNDCINDKYEELIMKAKKFNSIVTDTYDYTMLYNYEHLEPYLQEAVGNQFNMYPYMDMSLNTTYQEAQQILIWFTTKVADPKLPQSTASRIIGKNKKIRSTGIGKRCDDSGRAVITPDRYMPMDYIGIPYAILIEHFVKEVKKCIKDKHPNVTVPELKNLVANYNQSTIFSDDDLSYNYDSYVHFKKSTGNADSSLKSDVHQALDAIIKKYRYMGIRFPTLHKYSIPGFKIKIVYDNTIHIHPLVCSGLNADFDGDQMTVKLTRLSASIREVDDKLLPSRNPFGYNGKPMHCPAQDAIIGLYYLTRKGKSDEVKGYFNSYEEMYGAYQRGLVDLNDMVTVNTPPYTHSKFLQYYLLDNRNLKAENSTSYFTEESCADDIRIDLTSIIPVNPNIKLQPVTSTVGRFIFNCYIPQNLGIVDRSLPENQYCLEVDSFMDKKAKTKGLIADIIKHVDLTQDTEVSNYTKDAIKDLGYMYVTIVGSSIGFLDAKPAAHRDQIIKQAKSRISFIEKGLRNRQMINLSAPIWDGFSAVDKESIEELLNRTDLDDSTRLNLIKCVILKESNELIDKDIMNTLPDDNAYKIMVLTGSRGSKVQLRQIAGYRGMMTNADGSLRDEPIWDCFTLGLSATNIMGSSYSGVKGMMDRGNTTKHTGNLTRHYQYALEQQIIVKGDCGDHEGYIVKDLWVNPPQTEALERDKDFRENNYQSMVNRARGLYFAEDVYNKVTGELLFAYNEPLYPHPSKRQKERIDILEMQYGKEGVKFRTPASCKCVKGLCAKCYGYFLGEGRYANVGDSVGTSAASSMGEVATQAVMVNFHTGGVAGGDTNSNFSTIIDAIITGKIPEIVDKYEHLSLLINNKNIEHVQAEYQKLKSFVTGRKVQTNSEDIDKIMDTELMQGEEPITFENLGLTASSIYFGMVTSIIEIIEKAYTSAGINFTVASYSLLARSVLSIVEIIEPGISKYCIGELIPLGDVINANIVNAIKDNTCIVAKPCFLNLKRLPAESPSFVSSICFQDPMKTILNGSIEGREDSLTNPSTIFLSGNRLMTGSGFSAVKDRYKYKQEYQTLEEILQIEDKEIALPEINKDVKEYHESKHAVFTDIIDNVKITEPEEIIDTSKDYYEEDYMDADELDEEYIPSMDELQDDYTLSIDELDNEDIDLDLDVLIEDEVDDTNDEDDISTSEDKTNPSVEEDENHSNNDDSSHAAW